jgi:hypothetical protein
VDILTTAPFLFPQRSPLGNGRWSHSAHANVPVSCDSLLLRGRMPEPKAARSAARRCGCAARLGVQDFFLIPFHLMYPRHVDPLSCKQRSGRLPWARCNAGSNPQEEFRQVHSAWMPDPDRLLRGSCGRATAP